MKTSISVATSPSAMPQIMFASDFDKHCHFLADLGYEGIDLFFPKPHDVDVHAIKKTLDTYNLQVTMLAAQGDIIGDGLFLNNPKSIPTLLERSRYHLEQCAVLQAMPNIGFIRGQHATKDTDALDSMAEGVAAYCTLAADFGLSVLLEPICRYEINSVNTTAQALDICQRASNPNNLTLLLDIFHMNIEEASLCGAIEQAKGRIGHVHFVDNTRAVPGMGCLPLKDIVRRLKDVDYTGFLGLEAMPGSDPKQEARHGLEVTKTLLRTA